MALNFKTNSVEFLSTTNEYRPGLVQYWPREIGVYNIQLSSR